MHWLDHEAIYAQIKSIARKHCYQIQQTTMLNCCVQYRDCDLLRINSVSDSGSVACLNDLIACDTWWWEDATSVHGLMPPINSL